MNTIYKSIALEAALLSVTLALQAEIQSEGQTVTADVQASTLDRLKVTLVSPNVSGARDLVASGNAVIEGSRIAVNLENLAFGTHRLVVSARFGTQIRTLYALDISVPQAELPNETQEYEDAAIVVSTYGDGGGGGEFPTDYAKQGTDPTASLTDTQAYAQSAAEDAAAAKTAAQALSPVASAADAYNTGKAELAANITAKGVAASASETLPQLAQKVTAIAQQPIILSPSEVGDMYAVQQFGSLTTPNYWNLYEVLNMLLNDGRLQNHGGILLAEYYKGYDSLALSGAGAGGAYVVSDKDGNGDFIMYDTDTTHVWATEDDGRFDRWVAYCFSDEYHDFDITDTNTSPRSIHIGRKVGTIKCLTVSRISDIVVTDGNRLLAFKSNNFESDWGKKIVIRNIDAQSDNLLYKPTSASVYIETDSIQGMVIFCGVNSTLNNVNIRARVLGKLQLFNYAFSDSISQLSSIRISGVESCSQYIRLASGPSEYDTRPMPNLSRLLVTDTEEFRMHLNPGTNNISALTYCYFGYRDNDKSKTFSFSRGAYDGRIYFNDCELMLGWCKPLDVSVFTMLTEANMYAHILQRLKQDEPDCGDGVTITLGQTNLNKLTSAESIALLDDLTNIYGYTFA